jgi:hypothetical protein
MKCKITVIAAASSLAVALIAAAWDVLSPAGKKIESGG